MYYNRARYYNPSAGSFIQSDSYGGNPYDPTSLNRYAYASNNPLRYVDPSGHDDEEASAGSLPEGIVPAGKGNGFDLENLNTDANNQNLAGPGTRATSGLKDVSSFDPNNLVKGDLLGSGGNKKVYAIEGQPNLAIGILKEGKSANLIEDELELINRLKSLDLPTVEAVAIEYEGRTALLMERYAQGSKEIVKLQGQKVQVIGSSRLLNQNSIDDLEAIRNIMTSRKVRINDLQFLISSDGRTVVADPLGVTLDKLPSRNNLDMIELLIKETRKNL